MVGRFLAPLGVLVLCCTLAATAVAGKKRPLQHVTIFSDSSGAALGWDLTAKQIVENHNGDIVIARGPEGGTRVVIRLPIGTTKSAAAA